MIANSEPLHFARFRDVLAGEGHRAHRTRLLRAVSRLRRCRRVRRRIGAEQPARVDGHAHRRLVGAEGGAPRSARARRIGALSRRRRRDSARGRRRADRDCIRRAARRNRARARARGPRRRASPPSSAPKTRRSSKPAPDPYLHAIALLASAHRTPHRLAPTAWRSRIRAGASSRRRAAGLRTVAVTQTYAAAELPRCRPDHPDQLLHSTLQFYERSVASVPTNSVRKSRRIQLG